MWSDERNGLYIPVRQLGDLKGFVRRSFDTTARYKTLTLDKPSFFGYYSCSTGNRKKIVLVEDVLSALRVREVADSLALLTTSIKAKAVSLIAKGGYEEALVYLDSDNPTVKMASRDIVLRLAPFLPVRLIETGRDPKYETRETLAALIGG